MTSKITKRVGTRGISWQVVVELPRDPETGKRRQKLITAPTKKEAETLAAQALVSVENGTFGEADAKKLTLSLYISKWLDSTGQSVKPSTKRRYADIMRLHVEPTLGRISLSKLTPLDVQRLYADRLATGLSPTSVALIHNVLHKALKQAVRWNLLTRNVTEAVDPPREKAPEYITWNKEQVAAFLAVADQDEYAALWRLALMTGMRRGELLALKWEDVDLKQRALSVVATLSRGSDGAFIFGTPKTTHGRRSIALPQTAVDSLRKHHAKQAAQQLAAGTAYQKRDLVFATPLGDILHPNSMDYRFKKLIAKAGVPELRFHDLRHTSATLMLANKVHPKVVQERLGHADVSMTLNRYSHVTMDMQREAADQLDHLIDGTL